MKTLRIAIGLPAIAAVCVIYFAWVSALAQRPAQDTAAPRNLSEAAASGSAWRTLRLASSGADLNAPATVRPGMLDGNAHEIYPLEAAVLGRHEELFQLLRRSGASRPVLARIECLARYRFPELLESLTPGADASASPTSAGEAVKRCEQVAPD